MPVVNILYQRSFFSLSVAEPNQFRVIASCFLLEVMCLLFTACESKQDTANDLYTFRIEVKLHSSGCSRKDWENAIDNYAKLCQRLDEFEFSDEERREVDNFQQGTASSR